MNGKSSFLNVVRKFIGDTNCTSTDLDILSKNNFESSNLYKKLVVEIGEVDKSVFSKTATLKRITGGDTCRIEFKRKNIINAKLYAKPIAACNTLPETTDKTAGFFRRWTIIDFPNMFNEKQDIVNQIPDEEYENLAKKCLRIIKELLKKGEFTNDGDIEKREKRYEAHSSPLTRFIDEFCLKDSNGKISSMQFYDKYIDYLKCQNLRIPSKTEMAKILSEKGYEKKTVRIVYGTTATTQACIMGIKWKYDDNEGDNSSI